MIDFRLVAQCDDCARQYDVEGQEPGDVFHCSCGAVVTIPTPKPHESAAIHCSACGGPRERNAQACTFCGADFTVHELDLSSLCPHCMTRLSRRARYCHSCAHPMTATKAVATPTTLACPSCGGSDGGRKLNSRRVGNLALVECPSCAGIWLENDVFERLGKQARKGHVPVAVASRDRGRDVDLGATHDNRPSTAPVYRPCPVCNNLMNRQNYGRRSGVVVDLCRDHGVWFDAEELERILRWIEEGGLDRMERRQLDQLTEAQRKRSSTPAPMILRSEPSSTFGRGMLWEALFAAGEWALSKFD
ncbi:MAG: zf-TFIIB domain-containing protein [Acidobacteriota bacterium]